VERVGMTSPDDGYWSALEAEAAEFEASRSGAPHTDYGADAPGAGRDEDEPRLLPTLDLAALAKVRAKAVEFAIERIAPMGEVTFFTGPGSGGKSLLGQQLCTVSAAAIGTLGEVSSCLGLAVRAGPAIYATCEDTGEHLHFRQERLCEALGVDMVSLAGKLHLVSLRGELDNELEASDEKGNYAPSPAYHRLAATIKATGAKIAVLDNVAHLFAGNENDRHDVTRFINLLNRLARDTGAAIILIGHPNKSGDTYSGSTAWLNAVRSQVWIDTPRDADGSVLDHDARLLTIGKANYAPKGDGIAFRWHQWAFVRDDDLPADTRAEISEIIKANGENAAFKRCLASATENRRAVSHNPGVNYYGAVFPAMPEAKGATRKAFERAFERLLHLGEIELDKALWKRENRPWKYGIKAAEKCTDPPAPTPCTESHRPLAVSPGNACTDPHAPTPLYTTYITGAGPDGPPPDKEDD
jgi:RecA-family ATPase